MKAYEGRFENVYPDLREAWGKPTGYQKMTIRPLTGQVLIRLLPNPPASFGGIILPDVAFDRIEGEKLKPRRGLVIACGPWRKTRDGHAILPEVKPGDEVLVSEYRGTKLTRTIGETLRICRLDDVLALLTTNGDTPTFVSPV